MNTVLKNALIYNKEGHMERADVRIADGRIIDISIAGSILADAVSSIIDCSNYIVLPGLIDVHVHLREPGFSYKESIASGTLAAAHGGYTAVCAMPNLDPAPDTPANLQVQADIIARDAKIRVHPYGTITVDRAGEMLTDFAALRPNVVAFSDDGSGIQHPELMREAMRAAVEQNVIIAAHCEDNALLFGGYIHDGVYAKENGHRGICSESEWGQIARDLELVRETGCAYHVCHISTKESVELIRKAKADGLNVTCETGPHYLLLCDADLQEDGRFKMNPPLRSAEDRAALLEGICDGTIDMIATDHAPHSAEEKGKGLEKSAMGIVGLETAFPLLYTYLVEGQKLLTLPQLVRLMHDNPAARFGIGSPLEVGQPADLTVFDLNAVSEIDPETFLSMGHSTPFTGWKVQGRCKLTMVGGDVVWADPE